MMTPKALSFKVLKVVWLKQWAPHSWSEKGSSLGYGGLLIKLLFMVLEIEPKALHIICSSTELHHWLHCQVFKTVAL
jgi:hypothetical protein